MDGVAGYRSWRWIFLIEGIATCLIGVLTIFALPDWPEQAKFLTEYEKTILLGKLGRDTAEFVETKPTLQILKDTVTDPKVILWYVFPFRRRPRQIMLTLLKVPLCISAPALPVARLPFSCLRF